MLSYLEIRRRHGLYPKSNAAFNGSASRSFGHLPTSVRESRAFNAHFANEMLRYVEGMEALYGANIFHFKGARGILALRSDTVLHYWLMTLHVHISTVFYLLMSAWTGNYLNHPMKNYEAWERGFHCLHTLSLRSLRFNLIVSGQRTLGVSDEAAHEGLLAIPRSIKDIKAQLFEVEMNTEFPHFVESALGRVNLASSIRAGPYNEEVFPII